MEGFLPFVFKSLKKNKTRRNYECLSSGAAQSYDIADFYHSEDTYRPHHQHHDHVTSRSEPTKASGLHGAHHRRYNSVHVDRVESTTSMSELEHVDRGCNKPKQLVRFRSHRLFSCVTGA